MMKLFNRILCALVRHKLQWLVQVEFGGGYHAECSRCGCAFFVRR